MRAFSCEEKSLVINLMRGEFFMRANFGEHLKKCDHFFASKIIIEQINYCSNKRQILKLFGSFGSVMEKKGHLFFCEQKYYIDDFETIFFFEQPNFASIN